MLESIESLQSELTAAEFSNNLLNTKIEILEKALAASKEDNKRLRDDFRLHWGTVRPGLMLDRFEYESAKRLDELLADTSQKEKTIGKEKGEASQ